VRFRGSPVVAQRHARLGVSGAIQAARHLRRLGILAPKSPNLFFLARYLPSRPISSIPVSSTPNRHLCCRSPRGSLGWNQQQYIRSAPHPSFDATSPWAGSGPTPLQPPQRRFLQQTRTTNTLLGLAHLPYVGCQSCTLVLGLMLSFLSSPGAPCTKRPSMPSLPQPLPRARRRPPVPFRTATPPQTQPSRPVPSRMIANAHHPSSDRSRPCFPSSIP